MTSMVGNLSQGEEAGEVQRRMVEAVEKMKRLSADCEQLLAADVAVFEAYMHALRLPRSTAEEKAARREAVRSAVIQASEVPLQLMELCLNGIRCTAEIAETANKRVLSDLGIGAVLFEAAARSAWLTIEMNLTSLQDSNLRTSYHERGSSLMADISRYRDEVLVVVHARMG